MTTTRGWSRRQALTLAGVGVLGLDGCGQQDAPRRGATTTAGRPSAGPTGVRVEPAPTSTSPGPTAGPTRADLVARYRSRRPGVWSLTAPGVVTHLPSTRPWVALTFDACGGPKPTSSGCGYDRDLIDLLRRHRARATLFLNQRWIAANRAVAEELFADPLFEIGNHGTRHLPLSVNGRSAYGERGTADPGQVYDEITGNRDYLAALTGRPPRWFRPGTAFCDDIAVRIATDLGSRIAGFSVNGDAGTTFTQAQIVTALATAKAGDIVISHMNRPEHQTAEGYRLALPRLLARGLQTVTLSQAMP